MPEPIDPYGPELDPESLARKLAEQLRSTAPTGKQRRRHHRRHWTFPTAGVLRGLGVAAILLGVTFGGAAALPWVLDRFTSGPDLEEPDPSFSDQLSPTSSTSPTPHNQPAVNPGTPGTTATVPQSTHLRRGGTPTTLPSPTTPTTNPGSPSTSPPYTAPPETNPPTTPPTTAPTTTSTTEEPATTTTTTEAPPTTDGP